MRLLFALLVALALAAGARAQTPGARTPGAQTTVDRTRFAALPPELARVLSDYERAWRARDAEGLAALFAPDGFVLRSGHPPVRGRGAIREAYAGAGGPLHLFALAFERSGPVAYIVGSYRAVPERPGGSFVLTLRRGDDDRWLITADMDHPDG